MKTALTIIIYDRDYNLKTWCRAWELLRENHPDVEFRVICNCSTKYAEYKKQVERVGGVFIERQNQGFDIGALQDIARKRLKGFGDYDLLLWCVDDLLPVRPDFLNMFLDARTAANEITVFEIPSYPLRHVRTTGLLMPREFVEQLEFAADPVTTKEHCYKFEHREKTNHFLLQIERNGHTPKQIAPVTSSPMWDTGRSGKDLTPRRKDFKAGWPEVYAARYGACEEKVQIFATAFGSYPIVAHSLIAQSHKDWHLVIEYDGEPPKNYSDLLPKDNRIMFTFSETREQNYGHLKRQRFIAEIEHSKADFVLVTNHDNYYAPNFLATAVAVLKDDETAVAAFCDTAHSYINHKILPARTHRGYLDCGAVLFRRSEIAGIQWQSIEHSADWFWFDTIAKNRGGFNRWKKFEGVHFVHN